MWTTRILVLIAVLSVAEVRAQNEILSKCRSPFGCISSLTKEECEAKDMYLKANVTMDGCCPGCVPGIGYNGTCSVVRTDQCAPGLKCSMEQKCMLDKSSCLYTTHLPEIVKLRPTCEQNGDFAAKQCKGDITSGRCFCFSKEGQRIFGWSWWIDADDMNCACSRHRHQLEKSGRADVSLHCQQNGNYDELQCDSGICWCADSKTGGIQDETMALPDTLWTYLPCYNRTLHGDSYLRRCESVALALHAMRQKFENRGTNHVYFPHILCDYDGTYGMYAEVEGNAHCVWRDGKNIGNFQTSLTDTQNLNCNCARDQKIYEEHSLELTLGCGGLGNYNDVQNQKQNGRYYCIDRDGFAVSSLQDTKHECTPYIYYKQE